MDNQQKQLVSALVAREIELPEDQVGLLTQYCRLLWDWNEKINLTRHTDYQMFVDRDVVDTMALAELLNEGERVLDVGSGGGVPGVLLAIIRPDLKITLSESIGKKARVLEDIVKQLELPIAVRSERAEEILKRDQFDTLTIRAVARLKKLLTWLRPHRSEFGRMLLVKGPAWVEERGESRHHGLLKSLQLRRLLSYKIEGMDAESVILQISRDNDRGDKKSPVARPVKKKVAAKRPFKKRPFKKKTFKKRPSS
ncbi:MAG: 16S rRNA (guanine(527)-N(7))-methyltransferase RsmG [Pirellulales bacterium]|nr:16S rRNA (guanine(527)-N(7))-methyltransferase RsmG [Pirellulales bacterium]